jgi:hypothetical protein
VWICISVIQTLAFRQVVVIRPLRSHIISGTVAIS